MRVPKSKHIYVRLHVDHHAELARIAKDDGVTISAFIRTAILHELNGTRARRIRQCLDENGKHETGDC